MQKLADSLLVVAAFFGVVAASLCDPATVSPPDFDALPHLGPLARCYLHDRTIIVAW